MYEDCIEPPPVDPCEEQLDECLDNSAIVPDYQPGPDEPAILPVDEDCWDRVRRVHRKRATAPASHPPL